ncbi:MAG: hypothetical protein FD123_361 [Bacteroidetes bacterium]|nr:MAG: hypothetical protein FD123_361 [Bacteroidota bacterium]
MEDRIKHSFHYIKNNDYKTVIVTGAFGGVTIQGLIDMNVFTDRVVIPRKIINEISSQIPHSTEVERDERDGSVREVQVGLLMDVNTAKTLIDWLQANINAIEKIRSESKSESKGE